MIVLKESSDYLEQKKASFHKKIQELNDKICSNQEQLDEISQEKYKIEVQRDETKKKIDSIKKIWATSIGMILLISLFTYSINVRISIVLSVFIVSFAAYKSKNIFKDRNTYEEQNHNIANKEIKIENLNKIIRQDNEELKNLNKKHSDYDKGLIGEQIVTETLKKLKYDSYLINDVTLDKDFGNIDHILVSRYGIFIIETKNWEGEIICNEDCWSQHYENEATYNPVDFGIMSLSKRLKGNAKNLRLLIENKGFNNLMNVWVEGIIVFTNPNTKLRIINPKVPVLTIEELIDYIERQQSKTNFSSKDLESIANLVNRNAGI